MANWKAKKNNNQYDKKKKYFVPNRNSKNNKAKTFPNKNFQGNKNNSPSNQNNSKGKEFANNHGNYTKKFKRKEPIQYWECSNRKNTVSNIHTIQEEMTVGELARTMPRINAALENRQAEYPLEEISTQNGPPKMN